MNINNTIHRGETFISIHRVAITGGARGIGDATDRPVAEFGGDGGAPRSVDVADHHGHW